MAIGSYSYKPTSIGFDRVLENFPQIKENVDAPCREFIDFAREAFQTLERDPALIKDIALSLLGAGPDERNDIYQLLSGAKTNHQNQKQEIKFRLSRLLGKREVRGVNDQFSQLSERWGQRKIQVIK